MIGKHVVIDTLDNFKAKLDLIPSSAIVLIKDVGQIYAHGTYFGAQKTYSLLTKTADGLAPKGGTSASSLISNVDTEWVLTVTNGENPTWRKLPANAFSSLQYTLPSATVSNLGGIKVGQVYTATFDDLVGLYYKINIDKNGLAYVHVPWVNNPYTASGNGITLKDNVFSLSLNSVTKLDSAIGNKIYAVSLDKNGKLCVSVPWTDTNNIFVGATETKNGSSGMVPAPIANQHTHFLKGDGTWVKPNLSDFTDDVVSGKYLPLSGGKLSGTTHDVLYINTSYTSDLGIVFQMNSLNKGWVGYSPSVGTYLYNNASKKYLAINDSGDIVYTGATVWHSGNDGSDSGLNADLLDGNHASDFTRIYSASFSPSKILKITLSHTSVLIAFRGTNLKRDALTYVSAYANGTQVRTSIRHIKYNSKYKFYYNGASDSTACIYILNNLSTGLDSVYVTRVLGSLNITITNMDSLPSDVIEETSNSKILATLSDNIESATKLETARNLWGQSFDGTSDISGAISGCTRIYNGSNKDIYLGNSDNSGWVCTLDIKSNSGGNYWAINILGISWFSELNIGYGYSNRGSYKLNVKGDIYTDSKLRLGALELLYLNTALNVITPFGSSLFGMMNTNYCHIYSDAPAFYFDKEDIYAKGYKLYHGGNITPLRKVTVANDAENDFNSFENMTLTGRGDPQTGASLKNAPWTGSGPAGGYGVLTYLWSGYGTQMAWGYNSNRIYIRPKYYYNSAGNWSETWDSLALTSDLKNPTDYYWANVKIKSSEDTTTVPTFGGMNVNGTFNSSNYQVGGALELKTDDTACQTTIFGSNNSGYRMRIVRLATSTNLNALYSPTLVVSSLDTHAYIAWSYRGTQAWIGAGSGNKWNWRSQLITSSNIGSQKVDKAIKLYYSDTSAHITTKATLDDFIEGYTFKVRTWNGSNAENSLGTSYPGVQNGIILSGGWTATTFGFLLAIDDDPTWFMALRQRTNGTWAAWKRIPMGDGTGASGTWGISITGKAATAGDADTLNSLNGDWYRKNVLGFTYAGTSAANEFDCNTLKSGIIYNYSGTTYWKNGPSGMSYGLVLNLRRGDSDHLMGLLAWDINHASTTDTTRNLWWRASDDGTLTEAKWHQIVFTDTKIDNATNADKLARAEYLQSDEAINGFLEANKFKFALFKTTSQNQLGFGSNDGMLLSIPWSSADYGFQLAFDDTTTCIIKARGKSSSWGSWYTLCKSSTITTLTVTSSAGTDSGTIYFVT